MSEDQSLEPLKDLLKDTARAHHAATGGVNAAWAQWYADRMAGHIDEYVGFSPSVDTIAGWLSEADVLYRSQERDVSWARFYAAYFLDQVASG